MFVIVIIILSPFSDKLVDFRPELSLKLLLLFSYFFELVLTIFAIRVIARCEIKLIIIIIK